jgi:hypothetical protein
MLHILQLVMKRGQVLNFNYKGGQSIADMRTVLTKRRVDWMRETADPFVTVADDYHKSADVDLREVIAVVAAEMTHEFDAQTDQQIEQTKGQMRGQTKMKSDPGLRLVANMAGPMNS